MKPLNRLESVVLGLVMLLQLFATGCNPGESISPDDSSMKELAKDKTGSERVEHTDSERQIVSRYLTHWRNARSAELQRLEQTRRVDDRSMWLIDLMIATGDPTIQANTLPIIAFAGQQTPPDTKFIIAARQRLIDRAADSVAREGFEKFFKEQFPNIR